LFRILKGSTMSAGASAAAAAGAAAAARRRLLQQEEEEMTTYSSQDLADGWEFKILRSMTGAFKNPIRLKYILEEEARAGWVLVEKFDNHRIRLKRPASAREMDSKLGRDSYRTYVGLSEGKFTLVVLAITFGSIIGIVLLLALVAMILSK